jgi:carbon-monoxide dehydrogenase small subunit
MTRHRVTLNINARDHLVWVDAQDSLLDVLHDELGLADVRYGCGEGVCGTCTVLLQGEPVSACLIFAVQVEGVPITTVLGLEEEGAMHPLQECFLKHGGAQCGFCTPGMILTSLSLLSDCPNPSRERIRHELVGNLCRCTGYSKIVDAVHEYAGSVEGPRPAGGQQ